MEQTQKPVHLEKRWICWRVFSYKEADQSLPMFAKKSCSLNTQICQKSTKPPQTQNSWSGLQTRSSRSRRYTSLLLHSSTTLWRFGYTGQQQNCSSAQPGPSFPPSPLPSTNENTEQYKLVGSLLQTLPTRPKVTLSEVKSAQEMRRLTRIISNYQDIGYAWCCWVSTLHHLILTKLCASSMGCVLDVLPRTQCLSPRLHQLPCSQLSKTSLRGVKM